LGDVVTEPHPISRRRFIGRAATAGAAFAGAAILGERIRAARAPEPLDAATFHPPGEAHVAVVPRDTYDGDLRSTVADGLQAIGASFAGARVLLKPNFVEYDPHSVINTDPRLVAAAAEAIRAAGAAEVLVGEGPGHRRDTGYVVVSSGLSDALADARVRFLDLNVAPATSRALYSRYTPLGQIWLPQAVADADVVVSMPKMKTHHWAGVTLSLKNCFGCLPGRVYGWPKNALHWVGIDNAILDVAGSVRPRYAIVDGIVGMEGNGPIQGTPIHAGVLVFGDDPVATDTVTTTMMGFDPTRIAYLHEAARFLGQGDLDRIVQRGEDPAAYTTAFQPAPGQSGAATSSF
jgi:uncharacterized protein (DUF362 family)